MASWLSTGPGSSPIGTTATDAPFGSSQGRPAPSAASGPSSSQTNCASGWRSAICVAAARKSGRPVATDPSLRSRADDAIRDRGARRACRGPRAARDRRRRTRPARARAEDRLRPRALALAPRYWRRRPSPGGRCGGASSRTRRCSAASPARLGDDHGRHARETRGERAVRRARRQDRVHHVDAVTLECPRECQDPRRLVGIPSRQRRDRALRARRDAPRPVPPPPPARTRARAAVRRRTLARARSRGAPFRRARAFRPRARPRRARRRSARRWEWRSAE